MNIVLLEAEDFVGPAAARVYGRRLEHVRRVHRAAVGDVLRIGMVNGLLGSGRITSLSDEAVEMDVRLEAEPPAPLPVTLLLALPRPKVLRRVLQAAAAMGVKRLLLSNAWRVEKSFWESPALQPHAIREQLILGLEQARDTVLPEVTLHPLFKPLVEDLLPSVAAGTLALLAHPGAEEAFPRSASGPVTLAIGPEGGFIPFEVELLCARGFLPLSLGPRVLRVEQAVPALLSRLG